MILAHEIIGEGSPLLFLHGLGADRRQTLGSLALLTEQSDLQLIAVDFRAHGESIDDSAGEKLHFDAFADDIITLLDYLGHDRVHLGGLSMGAGVSLNLALRYPKRVQSLALLRPSWLDQEKPSHLNLVAKVGHWIETLGLVESENRLRNDADFQELTQREPTVAASLLPLFTRPQAFEGAAVLYKMLESKPFSDLKDLAKITHPALVLDTTHDDLHPQSIASTIFEAISGERKSYQTLPPRYLEKDAYNTALRAHLRDFLSLKLRREGFPAFSSLS